VLCAAFEFCVLKFHSLSGILVFDEVAATDGRTPSSSYRAFLSMPPSVHELLACLKVFHSSSMGGASFAPLNETFMPGVLSVEIY
jgi:hypothetical protein